MGTGPGGGGGGTPVSVSLDAELRADLKSCRRGTWIYRVTYHGSRVVLIVASALVASSAAFGHDYYLSMIDLPLIFQVLSVTVAVLTALDTWLKPLQKWRGFMESRDALLDLLVQIEGGLSTNDAREKFYQLRQSHRDRNVF